MQTRDIHDRAMARQGLALMNDAPLARAPAFSLNANDWATLDSGFGIRDSGFCAANICRSLAMFRTIHGLSQLERPPMERKYLFFHTARAAVFQFYALVALLLSLFCIKAALDIPEANVVAGVFLYSGVVVFYSFHIDRKYRGNRGL